MTREATWVPSNLITLDVRVDDGFVDIVKEGVDAGIRLGESVAEGMIAIRVSINRRAAVVASPAYWVERPPPEFPRDLSRHRCINRRYAVQRGIHRWRFVRVTEYVVLACEGPLVVIAHATRGARRRRRQ